MLEDAEPVAEVAPLDSPRFAPVSGLALEGNRMVGKGGRSDSEGGWPSPNERTGRGVAIPRAGDSWTTDGAVLESESFGNDPAAQRDSQARCEPSEVSGERERVER